MRCAARLTALTTLLAGACSCEDASVDPVRPAFSVAEEIDFGDVPVGLIAARTITAKNTGALALNVARARLAPTFTSTSYAFSAAPTTFSFAPGDTVTLTVRFQPLVVMDRAVESALDLETDTLVDGQPLSQHLRVRGRGVPSKLEVRPNPADFGAVLLGSSRTLRLELRNPLNVPVEVLSARTAGGQAEVRSEAGQGVFTILDVPTARGSLNGDALLEPGQSISVVARFTPDPSQLGVPSRARWTVSSCPDPICATDVVLLGTGTDAALECRPVAIDFGAVNPERTVARSLRCLNVVTDTVTITSWQLDPNSAPEFGLEAFPATPPTLAPGAAITIDASVTPTLADWTNRTELTGIAVVRGQNAATSDGIAPARIPLNAKAGGPAIAVSPPGLSFGGVQVGTRDRLRLLVLNTGLEPLVVSAVSSTVAAFSATPAAFTLPVSTATVVEVSFAPAQIGRALASLIIESNDASSPLTTVPLSGDGIDLGPCEYTLEPRALSFGRVELGQAPEQVVRVANVGFGRCLVSHPEVRELGNGPTTNFSLDPSTPAASLLAPGNAMDLHLRYAPLIPGNHRGELLLYVSSLTEPSPVVPLSGEGFGVTGVRCPPEQRVEAGTPVTLQAEASSQTGTFRSMAWLIDAAPNGGIGTPNQWSPDPPVLTSETFLPYLVGHYALSFGVVDGLGQTATCTTAVSAYGRGLRVELTWDGFGDVDLHVHNAVPTPWFGRNGTTDDCFYANCNMQAVPAGPIWDLGSLPYEGRNPSLDFDNIIGYGPENTRVSDVSPGDTFTVALHYFWDHGHGTRTSTVNLYCGPVIAPTAAFVSRPMQGVDQGGCTANDFWRVATVTFTSTTACTVTPIDLYTDGIDACAHL